MGAPPGDVVTVPETVAKDKPAIVSDGKVSALLLIFMMLKLSAEISAAIPWTCLQQRHLALQKVTKSC